MTGRGVTPGRSGLRGAGGLRLLAGFAGLATGAEVQAIKVNSGNASAGFVAASSLIGNDAGSRWVVPQEFHPALAQDAILLRRAEIGRAHV